jgi:hypothetical protein
MVYQKGEGIAIVDAGGGTIDISAYSRYSGGGGEPTTFKEVAPPQCEFDGRRLASGSS